MISLINDFFLRLTRGTGKKSGRREWGAATEFSWRRILRSWRAFVSAEPRINGFPFIFPVEKAALLRAEGITVSEMDIDPDALEGFRKEFDYSNYYLGTPQSVGFRSTAYREKSLEHFEGKADMDFIGEAARVLRPGGRLCILPIYFEMYHLNVTQPETWAPDIPRDPRASWYFPPREMWNERFGRFYSPSSFRERIVRRLEPFSWRLIWFKNRQELFPELWCDFALFARLK